VGEGRQYATGHPSTERVSIPQAADHLGTTVDAIRKRVQRGTIPYEKDGDGRVWILLDTGRPRQDADRDTTGRRGSPDDLLTSKDETIRLLREQLDQANERDRENRRIIAALTSRIPAIEAPTEQPPEPPESPTTATEQPGRVEPQAPLEGAQEAAERPWWRRVFGS
jgi:hypothetical protein